MAGRLKEGRSVSACHCTGLAITKGSVSLPHRDGWQHLTQAVGPAPPGKGPWEGSSITYAVLLLNTCLLRAQL